jgi:hypothetical protein
MSLVWFRFYEELNDLKFILDVHLGKLAKYLRLCGFDTFYKINCNDDEIISISVLDKRIILTRDKELLKNKKVILGFWIRSQHPEEQMKEVFRKFDLRKFVRPFTRCLECNGILEDIPKEEIIHRLMPNTRQYYDEYKKCSVCDHIYWKGSHYERMKKYIENISD